MAPHTRFCLDNFKFCSVFRVNDKVSKSIENKIPQGARRKSLVPNLTTTREFNSVQFVEQYTWVDEWGENTKDDIVGAAMRGFEDPATGGHAFSDSHTQCNLGFNKETKTK